MEHTADPLTPGLSDDADRAAAALLDNFAAEVQRAVAELGSTTPAWSEREVSLANFVEEETPPPGAALVPPKRPAGEDGGRPKAPKTAWSRTARRRLQPLVTLALLVMVVAAAAAFAGVALRGRVDAWRAARAATGEVLIDSTPAGARAFVDGEERGRTPLRLRLDPRPYAVRLEAGGKVHSFDMNVQAGASATHHVHLAAGDSNRAAGPGVAPRSRAQRGSRPASTSGPTAPQPTVRASAPPAGAAPGAARATPLSARPGASARATPPRLPRSPRMPDGRPAGWLLVDAPAHVQVAVDGQQAGTSADRVLLPVGRHTIELTRDRVGYRTTREVIVEEGQVATVQVDLPRGLLGIAVQPWADIYIGGLHMGRSPLADLSLPIGVHEVLMRHPDYGERTYEALVREGVRTHLSVDIQR